MEQCLAAGHRGVEIGNHVGDAADPDPEATATAVLSRHPLGRISTPLDVAAAIAFLASPEAAGITGRSPAITGHCWLAMLARGGKPPP